MTSEHALPPGRMAAEGPPLQQGCFYPRSDAQPFVEVKPSDPDYQQALDQAEQRLELYHKGRRYKYHCPEGDDVVDSSIRGSKLAPADDLSGTRTIQANIGWSRTTFPTGPTG